MHVGLKRELVCCLNGDHGRRGLLVGRAGGRTLRQRAIAPPQLRNPQGLLFGLGRAETSVHERSVAEVVELGDEAVEAPPLGEGAGVVDDLAHGVRVQLIGHL